MNNKRQQYGVCVDLIGNNVSKANKVRFDNVREQVRARAYRNLTAAAEQSYTSSMDYIAQYGYKAGTKLPTVKGKRFHILCTALGAIFYTNQYQQVDSDVKVCLEHGTPVTVFAPYKVPDMVQVTSIGHWKELMAEETASNKRYYATMEYLQWEQETRYALTSILNTPTPWLGEATRLHTVAKQFSNFADFLLHAEAIIADIETMGEWDIELTSSLVMNEKASTASYVANKGVNKGQRTFWCKDNADDVAYWYNYETLPADICTKYLHLTYLKSIEYKPLKRIVTDGSVLSGKELWFGTALEDMVRATPLYVDPYFRHGANDTCNLEEAIDMVDATIGIELLKSMSYKDALAAIQGIL